MPRVEGAGGVAANFQVQRCSVSCTSLTSMLLCQTVVKRPIVWHAWWLCRIPEAGQNCHTPYSVAERNSPSCRGYGQAIDCVAYVTGTEWVSGSSDGSLALWSQLKKKPVRTGSPPAPERARHEAACGALDTRRA